MPKVTPRVSSGTKIQSQVLTPETTELNPANPTLPFPALLSLELPAPPPAPRQASPELSVRMSHTGGGGPGRSEDWLPQRSWGGAGGSKRSGRGFPGGTVVKNPPAKGTWVRALVREDPTCRRATKPVHHNY